VNDNHREPPADLLTALGGVLARIPVTETVKATRAAAEATTAVLREGRVLLDLYAENARLREALAAATVREDAQRQRTETAEAHADRLRRVVRLLTEPDPAPPPPEDAA
jgi:hypothetical protein